MRAKEIFGGRRTGGESPEQISRRYHLIRVEVTLSVVCAVTLLIGLAALVDPENLHPLRYFAGCAIVGVITALLFAFLVTRANPTTGQVEGAMLLGLLVTFANTIYGGALDVDPWWQVCGYLVVIMIAGGVSLRRWTTFAFFIVLALAGWVAVIENEGLPRTFIFDTYILMGLGAVTAGAILLLFRTERRRVTDLNHELLASASHDSLTGILNRNGLLKTQLARREGDTEPTWCAYVDVDYFKSINDLRGHDHGDEVLRIVADSLADATPEGSLTARWGGDEFVVVGSGPPPDEAELAAKVNSGIQTIEPSGTVSVGIARNGAGQELELAPLLKQADHRMYERRGQERARPPVPAHQAPSG